MQLLQQHYMPLVFGASSSGACACLWLLIRIVLAVAPGVPAAKRPRTTW